MPHAPPADTIPLRFDRQRRQTPYAAAVSGLERVVSYAQLWQMAGAVAVALQARGIGPGDRVALSLPRGVEALAAMLGIMRLGAAYVPLDPDQPPARLRDILDDCAPACILTETAAVARPMPSLPIAALIAAALRTTLEPAPVKIPSGADAPAYIMYTSGSTGRPKGVVVPHRAVLRLVVDTDYVQLGPDQVLLHMAPLAFDASTFEIWGALLNGGRLAVLPAEPPSLDEIGATIAGQGVTTAWLTAGLFNAIADHRIDVLRPLRQLLVGGDVLSASHVRAVQRACPELRLINGYGPTENTTFTCCHSITASDLAGGDLPIGRPVRGSTVHILDDALRVVPTGQIGQLCTGGLGVALGYLNQPEMTASRFVPDPFATEPGALLYLTGDRASRDADGTIRFLGRLDRQVKVNGHRIELDEIERALRSLPEIGEAAAVTHDDAAGRKRLIGYVSWRRAASGVAAGPALAAVATALGTLLPQWAVPSCIVPVAAMPLTANGKIDRARLPAPVASQPGSAPARDGLEARLASIVAGVLGLQAVGRDDNFFDLGATSLQLIEVHAQIARLLQPDVKLLTLFAAPRISALAAAIKPMGAPADTKAAAVPATDRAQRAAAAMRRLRTVCTA